jgi:hypothetical protein
MLLVCLTWVLFFLYLASSNSPDPLSQWAHHCIPISTHFPFSSFVHKASFGLVSIAIMLPIVISLVAHFSIGSPWHLALPLNRRALLNARLAYFLLVAILVIADFAPLVVIASIYAQETIDLASLLPLVRLASALLPLCILAAWLFLRINLKRNIGFLTSVSLLSILGLAYAFVILFMSWRHAGLAPALLGIAISAFLYCFARYSLARMQLAPSADLSSRQERTPQPVTPPSADSEPLPLPIASRVLRSIHERISPFVRVMAAAWWLRFWHLGMSLFAVFGGTLPMWLLLFGDQDNFPVAWPLFMILGLGMTLPLVAAGPLQFVMVLPVSRGRIFSAILSPLVLSLVLQSILAFAITPMFPRRFPETTEPFSRTIPLAIYATLLPIFLLLSSLWIALPGPRAYSSAFRMKLRELWWAIALLVFLVTLLLSHFVDTYQQVQLAKSFLLRYFLVLVPLLLASSILFYLRHKRAFRHFEPPITLRP